MAKWWTDADCVRWVKTFDAMSWPYRVMDLSIVLAPIAMSWCAYLEPDTTPVKYLKWIMNCVLAGLYWLIFLQLIATHIRGRLAINRGIEPTPAKRRSNPQVGKGSMVVIAVCLGVVFTVVLSIHLFDPGSPNSAQDWGGPLFLVAVLAVQVSYYARARCRDSVPSEDSPAMAS